MKQSSAQVAAVVLVALACIYLLRGLLAPICWAGLIAIGTWPLHERLLAWTGKRTHGISATLLTSATVLVIVGPFVYIVWRGLHELPSALQIWSTSRESGLNAPDWLARVPWAGSWLADQWAATLGQPGALADYVHGRVAGFDFASGRSMLKSIGHRAMSLFFCVVVLFFLYFDGPTLARQSDVVLQRYFGPRGIETRQLAVQAIRGTVNGLVLVGLGLAVLMSLVYAIAGVAHPFLAGLATGLLGIVPFGAGAALVAVVLYLLAQGAQTAAIVVLVVGTVTIFIVDHFVRPLFISGASKLPLVIALLGIVAGLETFGILGLFIGPVLLAIGLTIWRELAGETPAGRAGSAGTD